MKICNSESNTCEVAVEGEVIGKIGKGIYGADRSGTG